MLCTTSEAASFFFWNTFTSIERQSFILHWWPVWRSLQLTNSSTQSLLTGHLFSDFGLGLQALSVWRLWTPCLFRTDCIRTDCLGCPAWRQGWHSSPHLPPYLLKNKAQILPEVNKKLLYTVFTPGKCSWEWSY